MKIDVQSVVYETPLSSLDRYLDAFAAAFRTLRDRHPDSDATVSWGDSSPEPCIPADALERWRTTYAGQFELQYTHFGENTGHGGGQNRLATQSDADMLIFANPDVLPLDDAVFLLADILLTEPTVGIVDGKQIPLEHPKKFDEQSGETSWCSGAFSAVRRHEFIELGMFDHASFFMHGDDVDLSWRYRLAGFTAKHQPAAVVFHDKRVSGEGHIEPSPLELRHSARSALYLAYRYGRDDLVAATLTYLLSGSAPPVQEDEARTFVAAQEAGTLPGALDGASTVAVFDRGTYGGHRW